MPDAPLPDFDTLAPPRLLPEYDNVALSHADRTRIFSGAGPGPPFPSGATTGSLFVDGFYRANWKIVVEDSVATLTIDRFSPQPADPPGTLDEIEEEGNRLLGFVAPDAVDRRVRW